MFLFWLFLCVCECVLLCFFVLNSCTNGLLDKKPKVVAIFYSRHYDYNVEPYLLRQGTMACVTSIIISFPSKGGETSHSKQLFFPVKVSALTKCQCHVGEGLFFVAFISEAQLACFAVFPN